MRRSSQEGRQKITYSSEYIHNNYIHAINQSIHNILLILYIYEYTEYIHNACIHAYCTYIQGHTCINILSGFNIKVRVKRSNMRGILLLYIFFSRMNNIESCHVYRTDRVVELLFIVVWILLFWHSSRLPWGWHVVQRKQSLLKKLECTYHSSNHNQPSLLPTGKMLSISLKANDREIEVQIEVQFTNEYTPGTRTKVVTLLQYHNTWINNVPGTYLVLLLFSKKK